MNFVADVDTLLHFLFDHPDPAFEKHENA